MGENLSGPRCALPRDYPSNTPISGHLESGSLNVEGFGVIPLPLGCTLEVQYPRARGISAICARDHMKTSKIGAIPLCDTISTRYSVMWGGGYLRLGR